jgi:hypothetical protein
VFAAEGRRVVEEEGEEVEVISFIERDWGKTERDGAED